MTLRRTILLLAVVALASPLAARAGDGPVRVSGATADAAEPAIAAAPNGGVYVAWVEHAGDAADVFAVALDRARRPVTAPVRLDPTPGSATAWRGDPPSLAVGADGALHVCWTAKVASDSGHATALYVSTSRDRGKTFGAPARVNDDATPAVHGMHSVAVARDGRVLVAWLDERNVAPMPAGEGHHMEANREVWVAASDDGGKSFGPNRRVAKDVCPCCKTSLAVGPDGRVYLSWRQVLEGGFRHVAVASSADGGASFGAPVVVSDDRWKIDGCPVSGAALVSPAPNVLRAVWYSAGDAGPAGLYEAESRDGGKTFGPRALVLAGNGRGTPSLVTTRRASAAVWESGDREARVVAPAAFAGAAAKAAPSFSGELPAAVASGGSVVVASVAREGARRTVVVSALGR